MRPLRALLAAALVLGSPFFAEASRWNPYQSVSLPPPSPSVVTVDPNGNTTSKTKSGVTTTFHFDIRDQLGEVRQGGNILGRYGYDYDGRRILKIGADGRRHYTYDQLSVITEGDETVVSKQLFGESSVPQRRAEIASQSRVRREGEVGIARAQG